MSDIWRSNPGGQSLYLIWADWEPVKKAPPCAGNEQQYDGHCFVIVPEVDEAIRSWSLLGFTTTAIVYGTPAWARGNRPCQFGIYCVPNDAADFGRFAGMLARRYNGLNGHGRMADFVLDREVGNIRYFDIGCGLGPCDQFEWLDLIAENYNAAFDAVAVEQSTARVMTSIDNKFASSFDDAAHGQLSGMTVLMGVANRAAGRAWRVSINAYNKPEAAGFSYGDYPYVTLGNIGILVGWLRQKFPDAPQLRSVQLTEQGLPGRPALESQQSEYLCDGFHNALGTPGVESFIYYRMQDQAGDSNQLGLRRLDASAKPSWSTWADANRVDLDPALLSCGFQYIPYTLLTLGYDAARGSIATTRILPAGYAVTKSWYLYRSEEPGTIMVYECHIGSKSFLTTRHTCDNEFPYGPVGRVFRDPRPFHVPLYTCYNGEFADHFVSSEVDCGGPPSTMLALLGYVRPA
ncbi:subtilisin-like serine protease [Drechmeria coniospora]|uniref:Subtilisin-like serine protease n=1 Tax=Drechmeria coniospora TaxID=98403 RepID=A0A151GUR1_DRECN|nr:subtilisin-like serine protease [Drechmeria coniospora]KYK60854.1 subtilisin-like serine protease [Drechmeria coniospora]